MATKNVVATRRFIKDFRSHSKQQETIETIKNFIHFRCLNENEKFCNKDYIFVNGYYRGYRHVHLIYGYLVLVYQITKNEIRLCAICPHKTIEKHNIFGAWLNSLDENDFRPFQT